MKGNPRVSFCFLCGRPLARAPRGEYFYTPAIIDGEERILHKGCSEHVEKKLTANVAEQREWRVPID